MIKILKLTVIFSFFYFLTSLSSQTMSKNIIDVIKEDSELSIFYSNLKKQVLMKFYKKTTWKWTIFAPTNKALKLQQTD